MDWFEILKIFGAVLIVVYLIFGVDDLLWYIWALVTSLFTKKSKDALDFDELRKTPPKMLAVSIAAWHEANVIGDVIMNFLNTTDYPKSMYCLFVGVYPNDPETIAAVEKVSRQYPNVHAIINEKEGPTTKAQNINYVITRIKEYEKAHNVRFASLTIHDSEDVIHTYELLTTNYLIDKHDALQFPVFPILKMPTFRNFFSQLTTATYADEFAENHFTTLVQRDITGAFVPCAGTGFAISRKIIESAGEEGLLPSESLTEDYLLSLNLYKKGVRLHYVLDKLPRVLKNGRVKTDFITTRSLFPSTFKAAVRQKTRWTYGISMQSVGIRDVFTREKVSFAGRYSFYKDAKTKLLNLLPFLGYVVAVYAVLSWFLGLPPLYEKGSVIYYMSLVVVGITLIRQIGRGYALYHVYGMRSVFFGCLLPPLFPIRLIYGNIINFTATVRAIRMKLFGDKSANKKVKREHAQKVKKEKKIVKWAKTDHDFLTRDQLRQYRRMLVDMLIVQGYITAESFRDALKQVKHEEGEPVGAYLIRKGIISEEQMIRALGHVKHIIFIPDYVAEKIDCSDILAKYDVNRLR